MQCDIEVKWHVTFFCNFRCPYCFAKSKWDKTKDEFQDIDKIVDGFNRLGLTCQVYMSGGEPFFFPNYVELCKRLSERHILSINTNLSHKDVYKFADEIDPASVRFVNCSVNMQERLRLNLTEDFIEKYHYFKDKGFFVVATYVADPALIKRLPKDYDFFKSRGVIIRIKLFRGDALRFSFLKHPRLWRFRDRFSMEYPKSYTDKQKAVILKYMEEGEKDTDMKLVPDRDKLGGRFLDASMDKLFIGGMPSFKGNECVAGSAFVTMNPKGDVYRCYSGNDLYLGNLFKGDVKLYDEPKKCPYDICGCPYLGYRYSKSAKN